MRCLRAIRGVTRADRLQSISRSERTPLPVNLSQISSDTEDKTSKDSGTEEYH